MTKYQEFDSKISETTKITIGFSLTTEQKTEWLKISVEIEAVHQDGRLSGNEHQQLPTTLADCGLELEQIPAEQAEVPSLVLVFAA